jgi:GNAT superfamily N-acetyltransferase
MPRDLAWQIRSFTRIQWPHLDSPARAWWDFTPRENNSIHFVLTDGDLLVSHASVNWRDVEHAGRTYNVFGLSTVFTYPAYRKGGHARRVVGAASDFIRQSQSADVAMLFCGQHLRAFYGACGWSPIDSARILYGDRAAPKLKDDNLIMMLFVSPGGIASRAIFEHGDVYVGPETW